jgi:hypothetical protein
MIILLDSLDIANLNRREWMSPSPDLKTEADPVSEISFYFYYLEFRTMDKFQRSSDSQRSNTPVYS